MEWFIIAVVALFSLWWLVWGKSGNDTLATEQAAENGDPKAQNFLGVRCADARDYTGALHWWKLAADQGEACAQCNLGTLYLNGEGVQKDTAEAVQWFRLAANQGLARGQVNLGAMHANGTGVAKDHVQALALFSLAANQPENDGRHGDVKHKQAKELASNNMGSLALEMDKEQTSEAAARVVRFLFDGETF